MATGVGEDRIWGAATKKSIVYENCSSKVDFFLIMADFCKFIQRAGAVAPPPAPYAYAYENGSCIYSMYLLRGALYMK